MATIFFEKKILFYILDGNVLQHSVLKRQIRKLTKESIEDNKAKILFSIKLGNMKKEPIPGVYNNIAFLSWMITFFWLPQQIIRGEKTKEDRIKMLWSIYLPHYTKKGIKSFINFYGEDYFHELGSSFELTEYRI